MAKGCALSTGFLPLGGLPRNSVDRITDRPDMTSVVDRGRKASTQTNKYTNSSIKINSKSVYIAIPSPRNLISCNGEDFSLLVSQMVFFGDYETGTGA